MEVPEDLTYNRLELWTYRYLQQVAKSMGLPSNVKKVYLIEMIRAKKYCSAEELDAIIERIKEERRQQALTRKPPKLGKKRVQGSEISSTSNRSPPISMTPRRSSDFNISSIGRTIVKYKQSPSILRPTISKRAIESDRVLRSSNNRTRRNYSIFNVNESVLGVIKAQNALQRMQDVERQYQLRVDLQRTRPINVRGCEVPTLRQIEFGDCTVQKRGHVDVEEKNGEERQMVPFVRSSNISQQRPAKRQRQISGIYPLMPSENTYYQYLPSVGFRRQDGRISKINALVEKPIENTPKAVPRNMTGLRTNRTEAKPFLTIERRNIVPKLRTFVKIKDIMPRHPQMVTVQEVINYKIDKNDFNNSSTESARESSTEREQENVDRDAERRSYDTEDRNRFTESNIVTENAHKYTQTTIHKPPKKASCYTGRKDYATLTPYTYTESKDSATVNPNRYKESIDHATVNPDRYNVHIDHATVNPDRYNEHIDHDTVNPDRYNEHIDHDTVIPDRYTESLGYPAVNRGRYTESIGYPTENPGRYTESIEHATVNPDRYTKSIDHATVNRDRYTESIGYPTVNPDRYTSIGYPIVNPDRYTESTGYPTVNPDRYTEIRDYATYSPNYAAMNVNTYPDKRIYDKENSNAVANIQNTGTGNVDTDYPNMSALADVLYPENQVTERSSSKTGEFTVYYHKKIRAEQVRTQRPYIRRQPSAVDEKLPRIIDVFSQFRDAQYRDVTQPLYVQVSGETAGIQPYPNNNRVLEKIYNYKSEFLPSRPCDLDFLVNRSMEPVRTTSETRCVYATCTRTTAIAHSAVAACNEYNEYTAHPYERANSPHSVEAGAAPRLYDYMRMAEQARNDFRCDEVLSSSSFGTTASQELGANVTIPEMVEDALELISQDGDYMERIGMDVRMQCILCEWAGPKIILEYHIKKEHPSDIVRQDSAEWSSVFSLGALSASETWASKVVQYSGNLFILSAKYMDVDCFMATLTTLPTESEEIPKYCTLTVYNKKTGEPHTWEGDISVLSHTMPYDTDSSGLKLDISRLDLLPNSANLKLTNGELVVNSTAKVVVGQPELDSIEIAVHVKVFSGN